MLKVSLILTIMGVGEATLYSESVLPKEATKQVLQARAQILKTIQKEKDKEVRNA